MILSSAPSNSFAKGRCLFKAQLGRHQPPHYSAARGPFAETVDRVGYYAIGSQYAGISGYIGSTTRIPYLTSGYFVESNRLCRLRL